MKESACQFGPGRQLAGVITDPTGPSRGVTLVLVSAGLVPRFGPYRLYTQLARRLAGDGFRTLRFDLGGIGDSQHAHSNEPLRARTAREIHAAIDLVDERDGPHAGSGAARAIVLGGLCSGAEDSFRYAETDLRVKGVVLLDPFAYRTPGWRWRHALYRAARRSFRALGLYRPIAARAVMTPAANPDGKPLVKYKYMDRAESERILRALVARGASSHFVYTGGMRHSFNHERQLADMFPGLDFDERVTLDHFPTTDHTQVLEEDRRDLVEAIRRRLVAAFPRP